MKAIKTILQQLKLEYRGVFIECKKTKTKQKIEKVTMKEVTENIIKTQCRHKTNASLTIYVGYNAV